MVGWSWLGAGRKLFVNGGSLLKWQYVQHWHSLSVCYVSFL